MLLKKSIDWEDIEVNKKGMNRKDKFVLFWVALFLIVALIGFWYVVNEIV